MNLTNNSVICGHTHDEWTKIPHVKARILGQGPCGFCMGCALDDNICIPPMIPTGWTRNPALDRIGK